MPPRVPLYLLAPAAALAYSAALWLQPAAPWLTAASAALLCAMAGARTARRAFYAGVGAGLLLFVPHLWFLFGIFGPLCIPLWYCLALWPGIFCGVIHVVHRKGGPRAAIAAAPFLWMGLEYYRSEVWNLRFAWLTNGYALPAADMGWLFQSLGVYGSGALLTLAGAALALGYRRRVAAVAATLILPALLLPGQRETTSGSSVRITGVQYEDTYSGEILEGLKAALAAHPDTGLFVLPEYAFGNVVPRSVTDWCAENKRWLIAGGRDHMRKPGKKTTYHNTAWVIGPDGKTAHRQAKAMPIQFFDDGLPATKQEVWPSPWGKLGLCICYDQNYSIVTDPLAKQGMRALIIPTMDLVAWGAHEHWLSAKLAATRAAEYGVPVIRLATSGLSVFTDSRGRTLAQGSFPGQGEIVSAVIPLSDAPRIPWDRLPAKICVYAAALMTLWAIAVSFLDERKRRRAAKTAPTE